VKEPPSFRIVIKHEKWNTFKKWEWEVRAVDRYSERFCNGKAFTEEGARRCAERAVQELAKKGIQPRDYAVQVCQSTGKIVRLK
jgi:hypothetical protein